MDLPFNLGRYKPSAGHVVPWTPLSDAVVKRLSEQLIAITNDINKVPYNPTNWMLRGKLLRQLGYPELAIGDFYKCILLVNASDSYHNQLGQNVRLQFGMQHWLVNLDHRLWSPYLPEEQFPVLQDCIANILNRMRKDCYMFMFIALNSIRAVFDGIFVCQEALRLYPNDPDICSALHHARRMFKDNSTHPDVTKLPIWEQKDFLTFGICYKRDYPWIAGEFRKLPSDILKTANAEFVKYSTNLEIREVAVTTPVSGQTTRLGVFAKEDIPMFETLLKERPIMAVAYEQLNSRCFHCYAPLKSDDLHTLICCKHIDYCSKECITYAYELYHSSICGRNISKIYDDAKKADIANKHNPEGRSELAKLTGWVEGESATITDPQSYLYPGKSVLELLRVIAICLKHDGHPLSHPLVSSIQVNYEGNPLLPFTFCGVITGPIKVLNTLGIDIFANPNFDTWVILTLWYRLKQVLSANTNISTPNSTVRRFGHFFKHSCVPNTAYVDHVSSYTHMVASRNIKKGEEVYSSHLRKIESLEERQKNLVTWLGDGVSCDCELCTRQMLESLVI